MALRTWAGLSGDGHAFLVWTGAVRIVNCSWWRGDRQDLPSTWARLVMSLLSSALRGIARHPVVAFMLIILGVLRDGGDPADCGCRDLAVRPAVARSGWGSGRRPRCLPGYGRAGGARWRRRPCTAQRTLASPGALVLGCAVHGSRRSDADPNRHLRPACSRAPSGGWPRALAEVAAALLLQLVLFQLAEEIGFTGSSSITGRTGTTP